MGGAGSTICGSLGISREGIASEGVSREGISREGRCREGRKGAAGGGGAASGGCAGGAGCARGMGGAGSAVTASVGTGGEASAVLAAARVGRSGTGWVLGCQGVVAGVGAAVWVAQAGKARMQEVRAQRRSTRRRIIISPETNVCCFENNLKHPAAQRGGSESNFCMAG